MHVWVALPQGRANLPGPHYGARVTNPYNGTEPYQSAWQQGYDYATQHPAETSPQTPDFSGWGYDSDITGYIGQVWQEGALAGGGSGVTGGGGGAGGTGSGGEPGQAGGTAGGASELPHYDAETDTLYVSAEEFPALTQLAEAADFDAWLQQLGIDPRTMADDEPVANA
jgi:hypothetical protein